MNLNTFRVSPWLFAFSILLSGSVNAQVGFGGESSTAGEKIAAPSGPGVTIRSPASEDFFKTGERVFPKSVQYTAPQVSLEERLNRQIPPDYLVGPGDQFLISFWGKIEDNLLLSIDADSSLFIPKVGVINTKNLTYAEVKERVTAKLNASFKQVDFVVTLYRPRTFFVYVLGSVPFPGPIETNATIRASEVLMASGGPLPVGSRQYIEIRRGDTTIKMNLLRYLSFADFSSNPYLSDGDIIFVPVLQDFVTVRGAVLSPGTFEIKETRALEDVIQKMGGLSVYADRTRPIKISRLQKNGERVNLTANVTSDFILQHGDELFVPSMSLSIPSGEDKVYITGAVVKPGPAPYQISTSLEEYIGIAGGLSGGANFSATVVYKPDGSRVPIRERMTIEPGDTIHVPPKTFSFWRDHVAVLSTFLGLATSIIVLSNR